jgi:hypothetical protein
VQTRPTAPASTLDGAWKTDCLRKESVATGRITSYIETFTFTPRREFSFVRTAYSDKDCRLDGATEASLAGGYEIGNKTRARYTFRGNLAFTIGNTHADAIELNLLVHSPADKAGKLYTVHRLEGGKLFLGRLDREVEKVPALDGTKEFHR